MCTAVDTNLDIINVMLYVMACYSYCSTLLIFQIKSWNGPITCTYLYKIDAGGILIFYWFPEMFQSAEDLQQFADLMCLVVYVSSFRKCWCSILGFY